MKNLILITSVINPSNNPLSYIKTRSVFTVNERFEQTLNTINTVKEKIPDSKIILVETSELNNSQKECLNKEVDFFLNLINDEDIKNKTSSLSKSLGEGTQTIKALEYIINANLNFENLFKISGRYQLNNDFNYENFLKADVVYKKISDNNYFTCFYKISKKNIDTLYQGLINSYENFNKCEGYEMIFAKILDKYIENKQQINLVGVEGFVSVCGSYYKG